MTYSEIQTLIAENLASGIDIPAIDHREVETALLNYINDNLPKQFDIKYIYADSTYLGDNFETNGLGKNLRLGWALCNGTTHSGVATPNLGGRMIMSYGGDFTTLNAVGGSKDAVVVAHSHTYTQYTLDQEVSTSGNGVRTLHKDNTQASGFTTSTVGESGTDKNMPPFFVLIAIVKL